MAFYETTIAIDPEVGEATTAEVLGRARDMIGANSGRIVQDVVWGPRELAYAIRKRKKGTFHVFEFEGNGKTVSELERGLRISESVLRYLTIKVPEGRPPLDLTRPRRDYESNEGGGRRDRSDGMDRDDRGGRDDSDGEGSGRYSRDRDD